MTGRAIIATYEGTRSKFWELEPGIWGRFGGGVVAASLLQDAEPPAGITQIDYLRSLPGGEKIKPAKR